MMILDRSCRETTELQALGNYVITKNTISTDGPSDAMEPGLYEVKIIVYPFESVVLDKVIEVR